MFSRRVRIELRIFAACLIAVVGLEFAGIRPANWLGLDQGDNWQTRLLPAVALYALAAVIRLALRLVSAQRK